MISMQTLNGGLVALTSLVVAASQRETEKWYVPAPARSTPSADDFWGGEPVGLAEPAPGASRVGSE